MRAGFPRMVHLEMSHSGEVRQEKAREEQGRSHSVNYDQASNVTQYHSHITMLLITRQPYSVCKKTTQGCEFQDNRVIGLLKADCYKPSSPYMFIIN